MEEVHHHKQDDAACTLVGGLTVGEPLENEAGCGLSRLDRVVRACECLIVAPRELGDGTNHVEQGHYQVTEGYEDDWPFRVMEPMSVDKECGDGKQCEEDAHHGKEQDEDWGNDSALIRCEVDTFTALATVADPAKFIRLINKV